MRCESRVESPAPNPRANIGALPRLTFRLTFAGRLVPDFCGSAMIDTKPLDELARRVAALIAATPAKDVERNLRALLASALGRLDLVTREEFDLQREALARARERLAALERQIAELEAGARRRDSTGG